VASLLCVQTAGGILKGAFDDGTDMEF